MAIPQKFKIKTAINESGNISGFSFLLMIDWIMEWTGSGNGENGIRWKLTANLNDLDFAHDIARLSSTKQTIQR